MTRRAVAQIVGVGCLVAAWHSAFVLLDGPRLVFGAHPYVKHRMISEGEIVLFTLVVVAAVLAWLLPAPTAPTTPMRLLGRVAPWTWALLHLLLVLVFGTFVTHWLPFTDDETAYRVQGRSLLAGGTLAPAELPEGAWTNPFVVAIASEEGPTLWAGVYPWMAGAWTAPGLLLGFGNLLWVPLGALIVVWVGRLARRWYGDEPSHIAMVVLATCPALIGLSALEHTSLLASFWTLLLIDLATAPRRSWRDLSMGAVAGATVLTRPVEGAIVLAALAGFLLWDHLQRHDRTTELLARLARVVAGGLPPLMLWLWHNQSVTGSPILVPYHLLFDGVPVYGFGATAYGVHTPFRALVGLLTVAGRFVGWSLAWPLVVLAGMSKGLRHGPALWLTLLATAVHIAVYLPAPFGQVPTVGLTYSVLLLPFFALATASLVHRGGPAVQWRLIRVVLVGWMTFVPWMIVDVANEMAFVDAPRRLARHLQAKHGEVILLYETFAPLHGHTYVLHPPLPERSDDPALWWHAAFGSHEETQALQLNPDRAAFRVSWSDGDPPELRVVRVR